MTDGRPDGAAAAAAAVGMKPEEMQPEEHRVAAETAAKLAYEASQLDWHDQHADEIRKKLGIEDVGGSFTCGRCKGNKTTYQAKQTRSSVRTGLRVGGCCVVGVWVGGWGWWWCVCLLVLVVVLRTGLDKPMTLTNQHLNNQQQDEPMTMFIRCMGTLRRVWHVKWTAEAIWQITGSL